MNNVGVCYDGERNFLATEQCLYLEIRIAPEFLPHAFDRFRQADATTTRAFGGLGLGLAIVRQLVELHCGTVRAGSEGEDLGSTFTFSLPLMPGRDAVSDTENAQAPELKLGPTNAELHCKLCRFR